MGGIWGKSPLRGKRAATPGPQAVGRLALSGVPPCLLKKARWLSSSPHVPLSLRGGQQETKFGSAQ